MPQEGYLPKIDTNISVQDIKRGFSIWKESTSTSPLGRVLSLYKIWLKIDDNKACAEGSMNGDDFFTIIKNLIEVSQRVGEPLERWKTVHNLFILKETNNYNIKRLRAIHKIDAELNLI